MYCLKCGTQLPENAVFCMKCGASQTAGASASQGVPATQQKSGVVLAPAGATVLKCSSCGAPISPKFGEMVITCEYCGTSITLGGDGWRNIQKHTMLPLRLTKDQVEATIAQVMDKGIFKHHMHEESALEEMTASFIPYWIIPVSARTSIVAVDAMAEAGQVATTAALMGVLLGGMGGGRRSLNLSGYLGTPLFSGTGGWRRVLSRDSGFAVPGTRFYGGGFGMGMGMGGGSVRKTYQLDQNYNFPVVAMKDLTMYQPHDYTFDLSQRQLFDVSKLDKSIKVLNGDISEDVAQAQAKTLVDQLQSQKAHQQHHMIQQMNTDVDVGEGELLHVPVWFSRYDHKGKKIIFVLDGSSGAAINSMGL